MSMSLRQTHTRCVWGNTSRVTPLLFSLLPSVVLRRHPRTLLFLLRTARHSLHPHFIVRRTPSFTPEAATLRQNNIHGVVLAGQERCVGFEAVCSSMCHVKIKLHTCKMSDEENRCGLPIPSKEAYCKAARENPHAEVRHLCDIARGSLDTPAPQSRRCPRTGEPVCRCGEPYNCQQQPSPSVLQLPPPSSVVE